MLNPRPAIANIVLEEALLFHFVAAVRESGARSIWIRVWENDPVVVLGRGLDIRKELAPTALKSRRVDKTGNTLVTYRGRDFPVIRRSSGGGTVLHGPGILNYSVWLVIQPDFPALFDVRKSYCEILGALTRALNESLGLGDGDPGAIFCAGQSDLARQVEPPPAPARKVSGTAQFRKRGVLCHHGSLIIDDDFLRENIDLLAHPERVPEYRQGRDHHSFITSLGRTTTGEPVTPETLAPKLEYSLRRRLEKIPPGERGAQSEPSAKIQARVFTGGFVGDEGSPEKTGQPVLKDLSSGWKWPEPERDQLATATRELFRTKFGQPDWL